MGFNIVGPSYVGYVLNLKQIESFSYTFYKTTFVRYVSLQHVSISSLVYLDHDFFTPSLNFQPLNPHDPHDHRYVGRVKYYLGLYRY